MIEILNIYILVTESLLFLSVLILLFVQFSILQLSFCGNKVAIHVLCRFLGVFECNFLCLTNCLVSTPTVYGRFWSVYVLILAHFEIIRDENISSVWSLIGILLQSSKFNKHLSKPYLFWFPKHTPMALFCVLKYK